MASLPQVARALQHVLTEVPTTLARSSGFCQRHSKVSAAVFTQTTVLGWLAQPTGSLHHLTQTAADLGVLLSPQGLAQRFTPAAATLLEGVLAAAIETVVAAVPVATPLLARFPAVLLLDSTTIALPDALADRWAGCGGRVPHGGQAALKLTVRLDLRTGRLDGPLLSAGRAQDKTTPLQVAPLPAGTLRIADLGFWSLEVLRQIAAQDAYFLSRLHLQTHVFTRDGTRLDLVEWLPRQRRQRVSMAVRLGVTAQVAARLLAVRVPPEVAAARRAKIIAAAEREGEVPSAINLALADWTVLVTNVPPERLTLAEAVVLARARWQIELLFKLWKNEGHLDEWRSHNPDRVRCEVAAKLTALIIQHWVLLIGCWDAADRSLTQAAQTVRARVGWLVVALPCRQHLVAALRALGRTLARCRVGTRHRRPSLHQLLADPACGGLA